MNNKPPQENFMQVGKTLSITVYDNSGTGMGHYFLQQNVQQYIIQLQRTVNELLHRVSELEGYTQAIEHGTM